MFWLRAIIAILLDIFISRLKFQISKCFLCAVCLGAARWRTREVCLENRRKDGRVAEFQDTFASKEFLFDARLTKGLVLLFSSHNRLRSRKTNGMR